MAGRRSCASAAMAHPTSCSSRSAAPPGCAPPTTRWRARCARAGATVAVARVAHAREPRTFALTDLAWAVPARRAARAAFALRAAAGDRLLARRPPRCCGPSPGAIRFDAPAAGNRPGRHGIWQRPVERRRLAAAPLLLPWSAGALAEAPTGRRRRSWCRCPSPRPAARRGARHRRDHLRRRTRAKKGLDRVLAAWRAGAARRRDARRRRAGGPRRATASATRGCSRRTVPRAAAPRARLRDGAAARGLRDRAARGARGRLRARHERRARSVRRAAAGARPGPAARRRRPGRGAARGARRPGAGYAERAAACSRRSRRRPSTRRAPSAAARAARLERQPQQRRDGRGEEHDRDHRESAPGGDRRPRRRPRCRRPPPTPAVGERLRDDERGEQRGRHHRHDRAEPAAAARGRRAPPGRSP